MGANGNKKELSEAEIKYLMLMSGIRLPIEKCALILGISKKTLERLAKRDPRVSDAIEKGRAKGAMKLYESAFDVATKQKNPAMIMFLLKTMEGLRETNRVEMTGADGGPIEHKEKMTASERKARIAELERIRKTLGHV